MMDTLALNPDDQPFQHYSTKHRVVAWISSVLFDGLTYTVRHGLLKGMKRKGGLGWIPELLSGSSETPEQSFWRMVNLDGLVVYDIGAFQGLLTLHFARHARHVIAYEPNSRNYDRLIQNLVLNELRNVTVRKLGIGANVGDAEMVYSALMPGGASVDVGVSGQITASESAARTERIRIATLDQDIIECSLPAPDFIKLDIEGLELDALRGARQTLEARFPALFIEMHGETVNDKRSKATAIVEFLEEVGYRDIRHVESGSRITSVNAALAMRGHLYCPRQAGTAAERS